MTLEASTTPISSKIGRREGLHVARRDPPHVARQEAPHANVKVRCMKTICLRGLQLLEPPSEVRHVPVAGPFGRAGGSDSRGRLVRGLRTSDGAP